MNEKEIVIKMYQNVDMGIVGIDAIMSQIKNKKLQRLIKNQRKEYDYLKHQIGRLCKKYKIQNADLGAFVKVNSNLMVGMKTLMDKSDSRIAKLMMEGTNKGLIQLQELLNHYNRHDRKITKYLEKMIEIEHKNNNELKIYL